MPGQIPPRSRGVVKVKAARSYVAREVLLPAQAFIHTETGSGMFLLAAALGALLWANSPFSSAYFRLWETSVTIDLGLLVLSKSLHHWVNDGLMTIFFFVVGLEIKREFLHGQLAEAQQASLPLFAALGGMVCPVGIFLLLNLEGGEAARGWGIPMATDIAFALGVLALVGKQIPSEIRIFLLTLAVVDDIGSILVIALFYTEELFFFPLGVGLLLILLMLGMRRAGVRNAVLYLVVGALFWLAILKSGVHATIAGVILGALTPATPYFSRSSFAESAETLIARVQDAVIRDRSDDAEAILGEFEQLSRDTEAPLERIERLVHPWSSFTILPLFALANSGIALSPDSVLESLSRPVTQGIGLGLMVGKLVGITSFSWLAVRLRVASLPAGTRWTQIIGTALLSGIGFTVSLFIAGLSYQDPALMADAKIGILLASLLAGVAGFLFLKFTTGSQPADTGECRQ